MGGGMDTAPAGYDRAAPPWAAIEGKSLREYLLLIAERRWWFISIVFLGMFITILLAYKAVPIYRSASTVQILRQEESGVEFKTVVDVSVKSTEDFNTQVKVLESGQMAQRVLERMTPSQVNSMIAPFTASMVSFSDANPIEVLMQARKIIPQRMTLLVNVVVEHPDAKICQDLANLYSDEFINHSIMLQSEGSLRAVDELKRRTDEQRFKIEDLEKKLVAFKEEHKSISFEASTDIDQQQLNLLSESLTTKKIELDEATAVWDQVQSAIRQGKPLWELDAIRSNAQVSGLLESMAQHEINKAGVAKRYRPKHPNYVMVETTLNRTREELNQAIEHVVNMVQNRYEALENQWDEATKRLDNKRKEIVELQKIRVEYNSLHRNFMVNQEMYQYFYSRLQQAMTKASENVSNIRIIDRAPLPTRPVKPNIPIRLAIGLFVSVAIGIVVAFVLSLLDSRIKTVTDIETGLNLPILGIVSHVPEIGRGESELLVGTRKSPLTMEEFRTIRSNLEILYPSQRYQIIIVTSTDAKEGKSFLSANLACTFATHGEKTLLLDFDLRRPKVATLFKQSNNEGLVQYFNQAAKLDDLIVKNIYPNLDLLLSGGKSHHPTELFTRLKLETLFRELRGKYQRIILDTPPLGMISDCLPLLPYSDGLIYVIRFNSVKKIKATRIINKLKRTNCQVLGTVLNAIKVHLTDYYYPGLYSTDYRTYYYIQDEKSGKRVRNPKGRKAEGEEVAAAGRRSDSDALSP